MEKVDKGQKLQGWIHRFIETRARVEIDQELELKLLLRKCSKRKVETVVGSM